MENFVQPRQYLAAVICPCHREQLLMGGWIEVDLAWSSHPRCCGVIPHRQLNYGTRHRAALGVEPATAGEDLNAKLGQWLADWRASYEFSWILSNAFQAGIRRCRYSGLSFSPRSQEGIGG